MRTFSEDISKKSPETQRRLYTLFQRSVKSGEVPALKLLSRFKLIGSKGQSREVFDYAYTESTVSEVADWIKRHEKPATQKGHTAHDLQDMTDDDLAALIQQQNRPKKPRRKRKAKTD